MTIHSDYSNSFSALKLRFLDAMRMRNRSQRSIEKWEFALDRFLRWCDERSVGELEQLTPELMATYQRALFHYRQPRNNRPLHFRTQSGYLSTVRVWCRWLRKCHLLEQDPTEELELPQAERDLPFRGLSPAEVDRVMALPDVTQPLGLRDRAMLETFYSTAMRCSELARLNAYDVHAARGIMTIYRGKGRKDRVVPIGDAALCWVLRYQQQVRAPLVERTEELALFVSYRGRRLGRTNLSKIVRDYLKAGGIQQPGSCHLFRHTAATSMLEHGADLRSLQLLLGHERLETTQVYTHVSIQHLKQVHDRTHPGNLSRRAVDP